jgi:hypothetical protein
MGGVTRRPKKRRRSPNTKAQERRVILQKHGTDPFGSRRLPARVDDLVAGGRVDDIVALGRALESPGRRYNRRGSAMKDGASFKTHPIARLTEDGIDYGGRPQPGDEIGYGMDPYRTDDCFQAAIATCTQIPIEQVPDLQLDKRLSEGTSPEEISRASWDRIDWWAVKRRLRLTYFDHVPVPRERWIGVIEYRGPVPTEHHASGGNHGFTDHCLVMCHDRLVFDPSCSVRVPAGMRLLCFDPKDITYGISFDKEE